MLLSMHTMRQKSTFSGKNISYNFRPKKLLWAAELIERKAEAHFLPGVCACVQKKFVYILVWI